MDDAQGEAAEAAALAVSLAACARQLGELCEQLGLDALDELAPGEYKYDDEEQSDNAGYSAEDMADECMLVLATMESMRLDDEYRRDEVTTDAEDSRDTMSAPPPPEQQQQRVCTESATPQRAEQTEHAAPAHRALLDEMNALSDELSAFTALLVDCVECSDASECAENPSIDDQEVRPDQCETAGAVVAVTEPKNREAQAKSGSDALPAVVDPASRPPPSDQPPPRRIEALRPPLQRAQSAQSSYQKFLRAHPPKPCKYLRRSKPLHAKARPKLPQLQLHSKMREILSSPTLWKEYQSKSFQQHIKRQQQARRLAEQESLEAERAAAAHFKRAQYALKLNSVCPSQAAGAAAVPGQSSATHASTYLKQFTKDRRRQLPQQATNQQQQQQIGSSSRPMTKGLLCGAYLYGKRQLGVVYSTCASLAQLEESICSRFGIASVLNLYRERRVIAAPARAGSSFAARKRHANKTFQRLTSFDQVQDGDRICATRDSYEDMAILCDWIKHRQQHLHQMQPPDEASTSSVVQTRESAPKATQSSARAATSTPSTLQAGENTTLWDANGRCMAVKKQLIV